MNKGFLLLSLLGLALPVRAAPPAEPNLPGQMCQFAQDLRPEAGKYLRLAYPSKAACLKDWDDDCFPVDATLSNLPDAVKQLQRKNLSWVSPPARFIPTLALGMLKPGMACVVVTPPSIGLYNPKAIPGKDDAVAGFYSEAACQAFLAKYRGWFAKNFKQMLSFQGYQCKPLQEVADGK